ncbi:MAG: glycosyltransferase family 4 protein [Phycisphaerales bacterium JB052]
MKERLSRAVRGQWRQGNRFNASHLDDMPCSVVELDGCRPITEDDVPDADVILSSWWETTEWMQSYSDTKGVKVSFLQHHEVHSWLPVERVQNVWRLPIPKIVVSRWLQDIARDEYGDHGAILVPNGLDTDHFRFVDRGLSGKRVVGAMSGSMGHASFKRFWLAVETVKVLQARGHEIEFVGFGNRVEDGELPAHSKFEVAPEQARIAEIYASCDCWLFTSDKEGYGLPLLESMACGTPVVATPAGAAPELLESGGGVLVDSDEPNVLADAVERVLGLPDAEWRAMSKAARDEAERHSWSVIGDRMESALLEILSSANTSV